MKLLIVTQKVDKNDPILGFFHRWIEEFAKNVDKLTVICLEKGEYNLPKNVKILSLGKEQKVSKIKYVVNFYKYIWQERKEYDSVFVHMNPIYVVLGGLFWRALNKKIGLWYTHKSVDLKLRIAEKVTNVIFSASKESFRLKSKKLKILGHGIDVEKFKNDEIKAKIKKWEPVNIVHIGRVTKTKNIHLILEAVEILHKSNVRFILVLAGSPVTDLDKKYEKALYSFVNKFEMDKMVRFIGNVAHSNIASLYKENDIAINLSDTGSMDKAVLEAMAAGIQIVTSNIAFADILPEENLSSNDPMELASKIKELKYTSPGSLLREYVLKNHSVSSLIPKIVKYLLYK